MAHNRARQQHTGARPGAVCQLSWAMARNEAPLLLRIGMHDAGFPKHDGRRIAALYPLDEACGAALDMA
ncbi:hypothetical protein HAX54_036754, partial [Datura stramonium]|nr:hypothetical protein [Datura stramonium]